MSMGQSGQSGVGSTISNEAYNVISALHAKLEGLEAMRKYSGDGNTQVWQQVSQTDQQAVELLVNELERLVQSGGLRPRQPGQTR